MSKFFEALERAEREEAPRMPATPAAELSPAAPPRLEPPVFGPPATATALDRSNRVEEHLVSLLEPRSFEAEEYRVIRHAVETLRRGANLQVVAVTSPGGGDGKTTTAINLAGALAQSTDARVLLADLDLRRPAVARQLGLNGSRRSLVDALLDPAMALEDTVAHLPPFNLSVMPAGAPSVAPYELLKSPRLEALLGEARRRYDYIVLDTPPFVPVPDCRLVTKCVDGFLVVVTAHRTPRGVLAETLNLIDPAKVVGLVFNGDAARRSSYYNVEAEPPHGARWRRPWRKR